MNYSLRCEIKEEARDVSSRARSLEKKQSGPFEITNGNASLATSEVNRRISSRIRELPTLSPTLPPPPPDIRALGNRVSIRVRDQRANHSARLRTPADRPMCYLDSIKISDLEPTRICLTN